MGFYENGLERLAAVCVGSASVAFGAGVLPQGAIETSIGLAGLAGFVLGKSQNFGPECARVRRSIQRQLLSNYETLITIEGDSWSLNADLQAADQALQDCLGECIIDRTKLVKSAVTPPGFPEQAVLIVLEGLGKKRPEFFAEEQSDTLPYRYACDVVRAGIEAAIDNVDYYRQLEPKLMFEMAQALGDIREDVKAIRSTIENIRSYQIVRERLITLEEELSNVKKLTRLGSLNNSDNPDENWAVSFYDWSSKSIGYISENFSFFDDHVLKQIKSAIHKKNIVENNPKSCSADEFIDFVQSTEKSVEEARIFLTSMINKNN